MRRNVGSFPGCECPTIPLKLLELAHVQEPALDSDLHHGRPGAGRVAISAEIRHRNPGGMDNHAGRSAASRRSVYA